MDAGKNEKNTKKNNRGMNDEGRFAFMKVAPAFSIVSLALVAISSFIILANGFKYGIDFAGGTEVQVQFASKPPIGDIRSFLENIVGSVMV